MNEHGLIAYNRYYMLQLAALKQSRQGNLFNKQKKSTIFGKHTFSYLNRFLTREGNPDFIIFIDDFSDTHMCTW